MGINSISGDAFAISEALKLRKGQRGQMVLSVVDDIVQYVREVFTGGGAKDSTLLVGQIGEKIVDATITTKRCLWKTTVDCKDVEHKIPKVVCEALPLPAPILV